MVMLAVYRMLRLKMRLLRVLLVPIMLLAKWTLRQWIFFKNQKHMTIHKKGNPRSKKSKKKKAE